MRLTTILHPLLTLFSLSLSQELVIETAHAIPASSCPRRTTTGDTVKVHYAGTLLSTGTQFDSSYDRGQPLSFKLGAGMVIKGWDQGLLDMCVGEKRKLTIPSELAYGNRAMGPIPAGSSLVFETELVGIVGYEPSKEGGSVDGKHEL